MVYNDLSAASAGEMAFRPSTLLGSKIEEFILSKWKEIITDKK